LCRAASFIFSAPGLKADNFAYAGLGNGSFGTIDLNTGVFTSVVMRRLGRVPFIPPPEMPGGFGGVCS
jgi:hypothetical protein